MHKGGRWRNLLRCCVKNVGHGIRVAGKKRRVREREDETREFFVSWLLGRRIEARC